MAKTKHEKIMERLSGPKGEQVRQQCDELMDEFMSKVCEIVSKDYDDYKWWYLNYIEDTIWRKCRSIGMELNLPKA